MRSLYPQYLIVRGIIASKFVDYSLGDDGFREKKLPNHSLKLLLPSTEIKLLIEKGQVLKSLGIHHCLFNGIIYSPGVGSWGGLGQC